MNNIIKIYFSASSHKCHNYLSYVTKMYIKK